MVQKKITIVIEDDGSGLDIITKNIIGISECETMYIYSLIEALLSGEYSLQDAYKDISYLCKTYGMIHERSEGASGIIVTTYWNISDYEAMTEEERTKKDIEFQERLLETNKIEHDKIVAKIDKLKESLKS